MSNVWKAASKTLSHEKDHFTEAVNDLLKEKEMSKQYRINQVVDNVQYDAVTDHYLFETWNGEKLRLPGNVFRGLFSEVKESQ